MSSHPEPLNGRLSSPPADQDEYHQMRAADYGKTAREPDKASDCDGEMELQLIASLQRLFYLSETIFSHEDAGSHHR